MNKILEQTVLSKTPGTFGILRILNQKLNTKKEKLQILRLGTGSILQVNLSSNDRIQTRVGAIISSFGKIDTALKSHPTIFDSAIRKFAGGSYYVEQYFAEDQSSVLLAGKEPGDIVVMELDPTRDLIFRHDSFLLSNGDIKVSFSNVGFGLGASIFYGFASGTGSISLTRPGGMYSVALNPDQDCIVNPKYVVAWEAGMKVTPVKTDATPEVTKAVWRSLEWMTEKGIPFRHAAEATLFYFSKFYRSVVHYYRSVLGESETYKLKGPGEIVFSSIVKNR